MPLHHGSSEGPVQPSSEVGLLGWTLPPLTEEDMQHIQGLSMSEIREWALSQAMSFPSEPYVYRLRALHNAVLPVNQLPAELLMKIFKCFEIHRSSSKWAIRFTGICRCWRETLVSSPLAWSLVDLSDHIPFIQLCLSRSLDSDVYITLHDAASRSVRPSPMRIPPIRSMLAPHRHRIARLDLQPYSLLSMHEASLLIMLQGPMPRLTELKLSSIFDFATPLHLRLDSSHIPQLQILSLDGLTLDWDGLILRKLTTLSLSSMRRQPTLEAMLDLLEAAPAMQVLSIHAAGPMLSATSVPPPSHRRVALSRLRKLDFTGQSAQCHALLSHLSLPAGARMTLLGDALRMPENAPVMPVDTKTLMTVLPEDMRHSDAFIDIRSVWLQLWEEWFVLRANSKRADYKSRNPILRLTLGSQTDHYDIFAPNALSELPFILNDTLTSLTVESGGLTSLSYDQWAALFSSFPRLLALRLLSRTPLSQEFLEALGRSGKPLPCPKLDTLALRCERATKQGVEDLIDGLHICMEDRSTRGGARLAMLHVITPSLSPRWEDHASRFGGLVDVLKHYDTSSLVPD